MKRRTFLQSSLLASGSLLVSRSGLAQILPDSGVTVDLVIDTSALGMMIRPNYSGLSYEQSQLGNPNFFAGTNTQLAGLMQTLGKHGVLRLGGDLSEYTFWDRNAKPSKADMTLVVGPHGGGRHIPPSNVTITPDAVRNLRDFLDRTGWTVIYGLNLGKGTPEMAADEAAFVMDTIGRERLVAFQIGNQPDKYSRSRMRPSTWSVDDFLPDWERFFKAVRERVPNAPFAGPDTGEIEVSWLMPFARRFKRDVKFISSHYYVGGPPTNPAMTIERLLEPSSQLEEEMASVRQVEGETGLQFRMTETNSCFGGGKPGVSNTFASALWAADYMYQLAAAGTAGINFHGGGDGWYTPIAGTAEAGYLARPEYYGMLLFAQAGPGRLVGAKLSGTADAPLLTAYALRGEDGHLRVALFNKNPDKDVAVRISGSKGRGAKALRLEAPRLDDTGDVTFAGCTVGVNGHWRPLVEEGVPGKDGLFMLHLKKASGALVIFS